MVFDGIEKGDILEIKGKKYQVTEAWDKGFDRISSQNLRWYSIIRMVDLSEGKMTSTHTIINYDDGREAYLIDDRKKVKEELNYEEINFVEN